MTSTITCFLGDDATVPEPGSLLARSVEHGGRYGVCPEVPAQLPPSVEAVRLYSRVLQRSPGWSGSSERGLPSKVETLQRPM